MKKPRIPKAISLVAILIILAAWAYHFQQHWKRVEIQKQWIKEKIGTIREGMDEEAVILILGKPDSVSLVSADEPGNMFVGKYKNIIKYQWTIFLGSLPFTVEGGSWAGVSVYFDEKCKAVIYVRWLIV